MRRVKKGLALFLAVMMALGTVNLSAFASEETDHTHNENGWVCEYTDAVTETSCTHEHDESCYVAGEAELLCELTEHTHNDDCYETERELMCEDMSEDHEHTDDCYIEEEPVLVCDISEHTHTEDCYGEAEQILECSHVCGDECTVIGKEGYWTCTAPEPVVSEDEVEETETEEVPEDTPVETEPVVTEEPSEDNTEETVVDSEEVVSEEEPDDVADIPESLQEFLNAVTALPPADDVTVDNAEEIGYQVDAVLEMYESLDASLCDREDVMEALEQAYAVYEAVLAVGKVSDVIPLLSLDSIQLYPDEKIPSGAVTTTGGIRQSDSDFTIKVGETGVFSYKVPERKLFHTTCSYEFGHWEPMYYRDMSLIDNSLENLVGNPTYCVLDNQDGIRVLDTTFEALKPGVSSDVRVCYYANYNVIFTENPSLSSVTVRCRCGVYVTLSNMTKWYRYNDVFGVTVNADYALNYDTQGGSAIASTVESKPETQLSLSVTDEIPVKAGAEFLGWSETKTGPVQYKANPTQSDLANGIKDVVSLTWTEGYGSEANPVAKTLYAVWDYDGSDDSDTYTVIYRDGKTGEVFDEETHKNLVKDDPTPVFDDGKEPSYDGYEFMGWAPTVNPIVSPDDADENREIIYTATWRVVEDGRTPEPGKVSVTKTPMKKDDVSCEYPFVGEIFYYDISVNNTNFIEVKGTVTDVLDEKLDFVKVSMLDKGVYNPDTRTITWSDVRVPAYGCKSLRVWVKPNTSGEIFNEAKFKNDWDSTSGNTTVYAKTPYLHNIEKERLTSIPNDLELTDTVNTDTLVLMEEDSVETLLYAVTVTGDPGAEYTITDRGAAYVGGDPMTGTIPESGEVIVYVTKVFTMDDVNGNNMLVNIASCKGEYRNGDSEKSSTATTPVRYLVYANLYKSFYDETTDGYFDIPDGFYMNYRYESGGTFYTGELKYEDAQVTKAGYFWSIPIVMDGSTIPTVIVKECNTNISGYIWQGVDMDASNVLPPDDVTYDFKLSITSDGENCFVTNLYESEHEHHFVVTTEPDCIHPGEETCSCGETRVIPVLGHDWEDTDWVDDEDCSCVDGGVSNGHHSKVCNRCHGTLEGGLQQEFHNFSEWEVVTEPTCTIPGEEKRVCKDCGHEETREIAPLGHDFDGVPWEDDNEDGQHKDDCESTEHVRDCKRCHGTEEGGTERAEHPYGDWYVVTEPTCTTPGLEKRDCLVCDHTESRPIEPLGHDMVDEPGENPDCIHGGKTSGRYCSRGDYVEAASAVIPALGHDFMDVTWVDNNENGYHSDDCVSEDHIRVCVRCNGTLVDGNETQTGEHTYGEWVVVKEPTCAEEGLEERYCSDCDHKEARPISVIEHMMVTDEGREPDCIHEGLTEGRHCEVCGYVEVEQEVIPALGHDYEDVKWLDHNKDGYHTDDCVSTDHVRVCKRCNGTLVDGKESQAAEHVYGEWVVIKEPTETEEGLREHICLDCDHKEQEPISVVIPGQPVPTPEPTPVPTPNSEPEPEQPAETPQDIPESVPVTTPEPTPEATPVPEEELSVDPDFGEPDEITKEEPVPEDEVLGDVDVPLGGGEGKGMAWALVNYFLMNLAIFESVMLLVGYFIHTKRAKKRREDDKDEPKEEEYTERKRKLEKHGNVRILSIVVAIVALITFILTENIWVPLTFVDKWTPLMLLYVIIQTIIVIFSRKEERADYAVIILESNGGKLTAEPAEHVAWKEEVTLTAEADEGFVFKGYEIISGEIDIQDGRFEMPESNVVLRAVFEKQ